MRYTDLRDFIARQAIPSRAAAEFLDGWLATYNLARKPAAAAGGSLRSRAIRRRPLRAGRLLSGAYLQLESFAELRLQPEVLDPRDSTHCWAPWSLQV